MSAKEERRTESKQGESALTTIFQRVYVSRVAGCRFINVVDYGLCELKKSSKFNEVSPVARHIICGLIKYGLSHKITSRGLRISTGVRHG